MNNALAHRDYSIDRHVIVAIKPGTYVSIANPGTFRKTLLVEDRESDIRVLRIVPETKPRNPRLADVLRVYRKWEGRGIGMATMVNLCLQDEIGLPYYRLRQEEVHLFLQPGKLLDAGMDVLFESMGGYLYDKLGETEPSRSQRLVLAYLIRSEEANRHERHTILLTSDNNHYMEMAELERRGLIFPHPACPTPYLVYVVDRELVRDEYLAELREMFGASLGGLNALDRAVLAVAYRYQRHSRQSSVLPTQAAAYLWAREPRSRTDAPDFEAYQRKVRYSLRKLVRNGLLQRAPGERAYVLSDRPRTNG